MPDSRRPRPAGGASPAGRCARRLVPWLALALLPACSDAGDAATPVGPPRGAAPAGPPDGAPAGTAPGAGSAATPVGRFHFTEVAAQEGLTRVLWAGRPGKDHLLDSAGTGCAWLDADGDGGLDAYLVNGWRLADDGSVLEHGRNALCSATGEGRTPSTTDAVAPSHPRFAEQPGAGVDGGGNWGSGVSVADYDGDGRVDLFVTNFGPCLLYRNRGPAPGGGGPRFDEVAAAAGVDNPGWNTGAAFFDADLDGDLDLYVAGYIDCTLDEVLAARRTLDWKGVDKVAVGPFGLKGAPDHFFRNEGDGRFTDATGEAGVADRGLAFGFGVLAEDFDGDGDPDLYVANDSDANFLYRNEGDGRFTDMSLWSGAAFDAGGAAQAGMGSAVGDVDGDGLADIVVTNFAEDTSTLYRGDGAGFFHDATRESGMATDTWKPLSWGTVLADLDNDGDLDLAIANGHIYPQVDAHPDLGFTYAQRDQLFENDGTGRFRDVTAEAGPGFALVRCSRGLAAGDYDGDGDLDLLVTALDSPPALLRNDSPGRHWLGVDCRIGPGGHGPTIGARIAVTSGGRTQRRTLASNGSYLSAHDARAHFGLGDATVAERVEVTWPDGQVDRLDARPADRVVPVTREP